MRGSDGFVEIEPIAMLEPDIAFVDELDARSTGEEHSACDKRQEK